VRLAEVFRSRSRLRQHSRRIPAVFGSFVSASAFPIVNRLTGDAMAYLFTAAALNVAAAVWFAMKADRAGRRTPA
jgi:hypothetical protein